MKRTFDVYAKRDCISECLGQFLINPEHVPDKLE
jgi:hypothetical protein